MPAHDTGQAQDTGFIADRRHLAIELIFLAVQRVELGASATGTKPQMIARDFVGIEYMYRAVQIDSDKVGHVHQRRDRPEANGKQAVLHPFGAWAIFDATDKTSDKHWAGIFRIG